jgi:hypothetical protein
MLSWFRSRDLKEVLSATKSIKVCGIKFKIKKIDPLATMDGSAIMQKSFDVYQVGEKENKTPIQPNGEKIRKYFRDLFMNCVVEPKLYRKQAEAIENDGIWIDGLLTEWDLVNALHEEILIYTYGKKKVRRANLQKSI